jgi:hypothetical protein
MSDYGLAHDLVLDFSAATERLRRHNRILRASRCVSPEDFPCWLEFKTGGIFADEMCAGCMRHHLEYFFRQDALLQVRRAKQGIELYSKLVNARVSAIRKYVAELYREAANG